MSILIKSRSAEALTRKPAENTAKVDVNEKKEAKWTELHHAYYIGNEEEAKDLINKGADLDARGMEGYTPRLLGITNGTIISKRDELSAYEISFLSHKVLANWLNLEGRVSIDGTKVRLERFYSNFMFLEIADSLKAFREDSLFSKFRLGNKAEKLEQALREAYDAKRSDKEIVRKIKNGELVFIASGWKMHTITLCFMNGYLAICNRGGGKYDPTITAFKIDPANMTEDLLFVMTKFVKDKEAFQAYSYIYEYLPEKFLASTDNLCKLFKTIAPSPQKSENCALASVKAAVRFAWAMLLKDEPDQQTLAHAREETKFLGSIKTAARLVCAKLHKNKSDKQTLAYAREETKLFTDFSAMRVFQEFIRTHILQCHVLSRSAKLSFEAKKSRFEKTYSKHEENLQGNLVSLP
ncbi:MAG: hypothetical protein K1000chlam2_01368 [Chlamydiae bacterium]|nr:hypothetical protein [Chlamydiota bacterium]